MANKKSPTLADISQKVKPVEVTAHVCVRGDLLAQHQAAEAELEQAQMTPDGPGLGGSGEVERLARKVQDLERQMRDDTYPFTFRKLPEGGWQDLMDEHGPREGKERQERWNPKTFPAAAVSASCVSPEGMDDAEAFAAFWEQLNDGQRDELFRSAYEANEEGLSVPFSVSASAALKSSTTSSSGAADTESP